MFVLQVPTKAETDRFIAAQKELAFSYPDVGATEGQIPDGYVVDHHRSLIGKGREDFERAKSAIRQWKMFEFDWLQLCWTNTPIEPGQVVAIRASHLGFYSLNASRIVYALDEVEVASPETGHTMRRFGFAYGTLPDHAESGEERFLVELDETSGDVTYDLLAFSRPANLLCKIGFCFARHLQRRFARDSMQSMRLAVAADGAS